MGVESVTRARTLAKERYDFRAHLFIYAVVNTLFVGIWFVEGPFVGQFNFPWPIFPITFWGLCVLGHYSEVYSDRKQRWIERETEKLLKVERSGR